MSCNDWNCCLPESDGDKMTFRRIRKQEEEPGEPKFISNVQRLILLK